MLVWTLFSLTVAVGPGLQADPDEAAVDAIARQFVEFMGINEFGRAGAMVSEHIISKLKPTELEQSWNTSTETYGDMVRITGTKPQKSGRQRWVDVECEFERGKREIRLLFSEDKKVIGMQWVPLQNPNALPSLPQPSMAVIEVPGTIGKDPWTLGAILTLPKNGEAKAGLVIVHDVGPWDRDGTSIQNKPNRNLAHRLADKQVAVLRYDKRSAAYPQQFREAAPTLKDEVVDDALAAIAWLRARPEVANKPIYLIGLGRGGTLAPMLAEADGKLAGIILWAAVARSNEDALLDQVQYVENVYKFSESDHTQVAAAEPRLAAMRTRTLNEFVLGASPGYWHELCDHDAEAAVAKAAALPCRILVLQPGQSFESNREDFDLWKAGLKNHRDAAFKSFDDLNIQFSKIRGRATPGSYKKPRPIDDRVPETIVEWCLKSDAAKKTP